jgi:thiamine biosynthesis lipoprotein
VLIGLPVHAVEVREVHYVMGTLLEVTVEAPDVATGRSWIHAATAEARRLDRELTSFDDRSPLMQLNRAAGGRFIHVPGDLYRILALSRGYSVATAGAFDVTIAPVLALWRSAGASGHAPDARSLAAARAGVGWRHVALRPPDEVALARSDTTIDLGGIGKGYAVDRIGEILRVRGARKALVDFGQSSLLAIGPPAGEAPWAIHVRRAPDAEVIRLRDAALSTSRTWSRTVQVGGRRLGHVIDPRSGDPLAVDRQATIVARSGAEAEAWSKAVLVDPDAALAAVARREDLSALLVTDADIRRSSGPVVVAFPGSAR